jgi:hypothetical protein
VLRDRGLLLVLLLVGRDHVHCWAAVSRLVVLLDLGFKERGRKKSQQLQQAKNVFSSIQSNRHRKETASFLPVVQLGSHGSLGGGKCLLRGLKAGQQRCMPLEVELGEVSAEVSVGLRPVGSAVEVRARVAARRGVRCMFADIFCCLMDLG